MLFVSQYLRSQRTCFVTFTDDLCVVQSRTTRMMIGEGELINGVYLLRTFPSSEQACHTITISPDLMHAGLGHPSNSTLKNAQGIYVILPSNNSCVVYFAC